MVGDTESNFCVTASHSAWNHCVLENDGLGHADSPRRQLIAKAIQGSPKKKQNTQLTPSEGDHAQSWQTVPLVSPST